MAPVTTNMSQFAEIKTKAASRPHTIFNVNRYLPTNCKPGLGFFSIEMLIPFPTFQRSLIKHSMLIGQAQYLLFMLIIFNFDFALE